MKTPAQTQPVPWLLKSKTPFLKKCENSQTACLDRCKLPSASAPRGELEEEESITLNKFFRYRCGKEKQHITTNTSMRIDKVWIQTQFQAFNLGFPPHQLNNSTFLLIYHFLCEKNPKQSIVFQVLPPGDSVFRRPSSHPCFQTIF